MCGNWRWREPAGRMAYSTGIPPQYQNWNYVSRPMLPCQLSRPHAEDVLGQTLAANQTIVQDLDGAIDIIFITRTSARLSPQD